VSEQSLRLSNLLITLEALLSPKDTDKPKADSLASAALVLHSQLVTKLPLTLLLSSHAR
jgi:hypothetical protein